jgi:hypothetical protein
MDSAKLQYKSESLVIDSEDESNKAATKLLCKVPIKNEETLSQQLKGNQKNQKMQKRKLDEVCSHIEKGAGE